MTMAQGGLFNGDEETSGVPTFASNGQSQTEKAKYARAYRRDPENNLRINQQKKRRRALKKESQFGNVSPMFESAARPAKSEQQTVETGITSHDNKSLPDSGLQENSVCNDLAQAAILRQLSEIRSELSRQRDEIQSFVKPATQPMLVDQEQASVSGIAIANGDNLAKYTAERQANVCSNEGIDDNVTVGKSDFLAGFLKQLSQLDGAAFARNFPAALVLGYCAYLACCFVVEQTLPLYQSLKFPNPELASYGAIGLAIGFSALSVISKSSLAKLFAAIIIAYEVLIVWAGSQANQRDLSLEALRANPIHFSASEAHRIAKADYEQKMARYEDKNSEVYHNGWFKINHLDPAKKTLDEASAKLVAIESELGERYQTDWMHLVLKALYRLSAVALVMLLAKEAMRRGVCALSFWNTTSRKHAFPD